MGLFDKLQDLNDTLAPGDPGAQYRRQKKNEAKYAAKQQAQEMERMLERREQAAAKRERAASERAAKEAKKEAVRQRERDKKQAAKDKIQAKKDARKAKVDAKREAAREQREEQMEIRREANRERAAELKEVKKARRAAEKKADMEAEAQGLIAPTSWQAILIFVPILFACQYFWFHGSKFWYWFAGIMLLGVLIPIAQAKNESPGKRKFALIWVACWTVAFIGVDLYHRYIAEAPVEVVP